MCRRSDTQPGRQLTTNKACHGAAVQPLKNLRRSIEEFAQANGQFPGGIGLLQPAARLRQLSAGDRRLGIAGCKKHLDFRPQCPNFVRQFVTGHAARHHDISEQQGDVRIFLESR